MGEVRSTRGLPLACRNDGTGPGTGWRRPGSLLQAVSHRENLWEVLLIGQHREFLQPLDERAACSQAVSWRC